MATHYSKVLSSGQKVEIDDVNVTVDDSRYPTRNISAVHLTKASKPSPITIILGILLMLFGVCLVIFIFASQALGYKLTGTGFAIFVGIIGFIIGWKLFNKVQVPCHSISFGSSGNDKDLIIIPAIESTNVIELIKASFKWEESIQDSYNEIKACSNAISDAIDELQRRGS